MAFTQTDEGEETKPYTGPDSTAASLLAHLRHVPKWSGDELHDHLDEVIRVRSQGDFWDPPLPDRKWKRTVDSQLHTDRRLGGPSWRTSQMALPARRPKVEPDSTEHEASPSLTHNGVKEEIPPDQRESTVDDLLQFAGTWVGDDFEECLEAVYASRSLVEF
ncbi:MAG: hypothetical protein ACRDJH_10980 [Thermomicrobiales bacterium]